RCRSSIGLHTRQARWSEKAVGGLLSLSRSHIVSLVSYLSTVEMKGASMTTTAQPVLLFRPEDPDAPFVPDPDKISPRLVEIKEALVTAVRTVLRDKNVTHVEYEKFRQILIRLQEMQAVHGWFDIWLDKMVDISADDEWAGTTSNPEGPL